jgi:hypothetical protein
MGCDCHPYVEERQGDGSWALIRKISYDDPEPAFVCFRTRNYRLFGVLAGVRGSHPALFVRRGLPSDVSDATRTAVIDVGYYHSITHFTVQELLDTGWDTIIGQETAELGPSAYLQWLEAGRKGVFEDTVLSQDILVTEEEMVLSLAGGLRTRRSGRTKPTNWSKLKPMKYVEVTSPVTYRDVIPDFVDNVIPALVKLGDPRNVRVVIGFDS